MRKAIALLLIFVCLATNCLAEYDGVRVQTDMLNGRADPRKTAPIEARFEYGDILQPTGEWSNDHKWIEVYGGETGTVWVSIRFISEKKHFTAINRDYREVKIRKWPVCGRIVKNIKKGQKVEIEQVVLGWGKTKRGWVDLYYLEESQNIHLQ